MHPWHACDGRYRRGTARRRQEHDGILEAYPYFEGDDIREALAYAAWRAEEQEVPLVQP